MYTRWRPVPSARTVRILYQLGYICSGTALGLVTLCLEEQRRRIQILQRVADTAKVIRQHPRYRGNVALAAANEDERVDEEVEASTVPYSTVKRRIRSRFEANESNDGQSEGPFLPFAVGTKYSESLNESGSDTRKKAEYTVRRPSILHSGSYARHISLGKDPPAPKPPALSKPVDLDQSGLSEGLQTLFETEQLDSRRYRTLERAKSAPDFESNLFKVRVFHGSGPTLVINTDWSSDASGLDSHSSIEQSERPGVTPDDVSHDVRLFLWETLNSMKARPLSKNKVSGKLLVTALRFGSLEDIRALWLWKLENQHFTTIDAQHICNLCGKLRTRHNPAPLDRFFASMFASISFLSIDFRLQLQIALTVLGRCFDGNVSLEDFQVLGAVRRICRSAEVALLSEVMATITEGLANRGESKSAVRLFVRMANSKLPNWSLEERLALVNSLFEAVAASGALQQCATLLRWKARKTSYEAVLPMINSFVELCHDRNAVGLIIGVFARDIGIKSHLPGWNRLLEDLTPKNRDMLVAALSTWEGLSEEIYRSLPQSMRLTVNESVIKSLRYFWRSTRNFQQVERRIQVFTMRLKEVNDQESLRELEEISFEIYTSASKMDRAMRLIARMHRESRMSNTALCQTAYMFAKQGSWQSFLRVLDVMREWSNFRLDEETMRTLNATLHLYCEQHSAEEILNLVTRMLSELKFVPNVATSAIILESFVTKQQFELIPKWAELLSTSEHRWDITGRIATGMLRRFYIDQRPSHVFTMLLCRRLAVQSPSFICEEMKELVGQSIAYDLRHMSGRVAPWRDAHAMKRLERHKETKLLVPSPGFAWNEHLYFHDSETGVHANELQSPAAENGIDERDESLEEYTFDEHLSVDALRSDESSEYTSVRYLENERGYSTRCMKRLEGRMWLYISTKEYGKALELYRETLDSAGIPASPIILELAVEAALRRDGNDKSNALEIMSQAQEAGMNTTCANGPLLLNQLRYGNSDQKLDAFLLFKSIEDYYLSNEENGWRVSHYLGVFAAHTLMKRRQPRLGLDLLSSIYNTKATQKQPLDVVALTIFLRGYIALQSIEGVQWVIQTVLNENIRITKKFIKQVRFLTRGDYKWMDTLPASLHPLYESLLQSCEDRYDEQRTEARRLGWELVEQIANCSNDKSDVGAYLPYYNTNYISPDDGSATEAAEYNDFIDESYYSDESVDETSEPTKFESLRKRIIDDWNAEQVFMRKMKKAAHARVSRDRPSSLLVREEDEEGVFDVWKIGSEYDIIAPGLTDELKQESLTQSAKNGDSSPEKEHSVVEGTNGTEDLATAMERFNDHQSPNEAEDVPSFKPFS